MSVKQFDDEVFALLAQERARQKESLSLIASENIVSKEVMAVVGSELTNKYAEGYPDRRYYGGCRIHDQIESLAILRAQELFACEHANVQPHSGSNANMAALFSLASMGDTILAMDLGHGGHLTHGSPVNFSGRWFHVVSYGVSKDQEIIDYDHILKLAEQHRPKIIIAGASAYSRTIDFARFHEIAQKVQAYLLVDMAHIAGLIAAGLHPSPAPFADIITTTTHKTLRGPRGGMILSKKAYQKSVDSWVFPGLQGGPLMHEIAGKAVCLKEAMMPEFKEYQKQVIANARRLAGFLASSGLRIVSGGTDNHLILIDVSPLHKTGKEAEAALDEIGIVANKNKIPFDDKPPTITSGLRLGTPSVTSRGMKESEMDLIGEIIVAAIKGLAPKSVLQEKVRGLVGRFVMD